MELAETVATILKHAPGEPLCDACLAFACAVSLTQMRAVTEQLLEKDLSFTPGSNCASCRRAVASVIYRASPTKCAHCSRPVEPENQSEILDGDLFHATCLHRLMTDATIRLSRALSQRSRQLIEQSRGRIRHGRGWPPLDSSA